MTIFLAAVLRPFFYLFVWVLAVWPLMWLINKYMPDSKLKRALFKKREFN